MKSTRHHIVRRTAIAAMTVLTVVLPSLLRAQTLANYSVSRTTGISYIGINSTGNSFPSWRNSTDGNYNEDDNRSYPVDIGFDFWYNGVRYTQFSVSTNGFMDLSPSTDDGGPLVHAYGPYDDDMSEDNTSENTTLAIAPFYYDLTTYGVVDPLGESIHYEVSGTVGNRVLTVEWYRMEPWVNGGGGDPDFTFQVKLYESTGQIEFVYGAMNLNGFVFANQVYQVAKGYTAGMNSGTISASPTAAQLFLQQTPNSTTFSNANAFGNEADAAHNLGTAPASNSKITIAPPAMTAPTTLTFTAVSQTGMTLNWTDASANEVGFVIYRSDDGGATYNFITQTAANATSYAVTGLLAGTTYYYRVYAVNEGRLSSALSGNQATAAPGSPVTIASGSWKNKNIWSTNTVPGISDNATIADGHVVTIDSLVTVNSITVGQGTSGTLLIGDNATPRTITVIGNIDVKAGGIFRVNANSNTSSHSITTSGNILNAGRFVMATDADSRCAVTFNKSGTQTISGNGDSTMFHTITLNMGSSRTNVLDVFATNFRAYATGFLTITNGTFNLATGATVTPFTTSVSVPLSGGIRVNHASAVLNTTGGSTTVLGEFKVQAGTVNIGSAADNNLISRGGIFEFSGGTTTVAGRFEPFSAFDITDFTMSGGTLIVGGTGSTSTTSSPFTMSVAGSRFTMSGGTIVVRREGGGGGNDLGFVNTGYSNYSVTGGTVQIGDGSTPSGQTMSVNTAIPVYNFVVNSGNATALLVTNNLTVLNDVSITLGTLNANGRDIAVVGNWSNSNQTFTPGTGTVTFNGTGAQNVSRALGETFYRWSIVKTSGTVSLVNPVTVSDAFQLTSGTLAVGTSSLTLNGTVTGGGTLTSSASGTVSYNRSANSQTVLEANYGDLNFSNFLKDLPAAVIGIAGAFNPGNASGHTVTGNTIEYNGTGPQSIASFQYNDLTLTNNSTKTVQSGADTVLGSLTINTNAALVNNGVTLRVMGNIVHNGSHSGTGSLVLNGSSSQTISGTGTFQNLTVNNASGAVIVGDKTVNGTLTFTNGVITTYSDTLYIASGGSVVKTAGHVFGWLKKYVPNTDGITVTYEVGDAAVADSTPVTFTFTDMTSAGNLAVTTVNEDHPDVSSSYIDQTANVNRYWRSIPSDGFAYTIGTGYSITARFRNPDDLDATGNETTYRMNLYNGIRWDSTTAGTRTTTTNQATGVDSLGVYVVGIQVTSGAYRSAATGNWNVLATWERFNGVTWATPTIGQGTPDFNDGLITIRNGHTVTVTAAVTIDQTVIESGGQVTINGGNLTLNTVNNALVVNGTLRWQANTFSGWTAARLKFNAGSVYQHAMTNADQTTVPTATWAASSTCEIRGTTGGDNNTFRNTLIQTFGNFTWAPSSMSASVVFNGLLTNVAGNLRIASPNNNVLALYNTQTGTTNIGGSLIVESGYLRIKDGGGTAVVNVAGNDSLVAGTLQLSDNGAIYLRTAGGLYVHGGTLDLAAAGVTDSLTIKGDLVLAGGTVTETSTGSGVIALQGTAVQSYTDGATISNNINFVVFSNAIADLGTGVVGGQSFTAAAGSTLRLGNTAGITSAGATGNVQTTTRTFSTTANYVYNGGAAQATGNGLPATVNKLEIDNAGGVTLTTSVSVTDSLKLTNGNLAIGSNTLTITNVASLTSGTLSSGATGTVIYNRASNGQAVLPMPYGNLTFSNLNKILPSGTVSIAGTFTPGSATGHTTTGNTIEYNGSTPQNLAAWAYYNNLTVSGTNWKKLTGNTTVNGNLSVSNGTLSDSIYTLTVKGNIANTSLITGTNYLGKTVLTSGASAHALSGNGRYWILELNDVNGATASADITIDSILVLTSGVLTASSNTVICSALPGVYRPVTGGHVNGRIRKTVSASPVPQNYTFEVGDAAAYTPVDMTFQSVSVAGTVTAYQTTGDHPLLKWSGLDQTKSVNRYYTLSGSGLTFTTYDATFNFVSGDIDGGANTAYFFVKRYNAPSWYPSTVNVRQSTSTRTLGITAFGDFAVGEAASIFYWTQGAGTYNWSDDYNWSSHSVPTAGNTVVFDADDTVEVNIAAVCKDLILHNDTLRLTILAGKTLTVNGDLTQYSGQFSTRASFPAVTGTVSMLGGLFGYDSSGGTQTVAVQTYRELRLSGGGTKSAAGSFTVNRNLTIAPSVTFAGGANTITVKDSLTNDGVHTSTGAGRILLDGTTQHRLGGNGSFGSLELNNASNGATLAGTLTVNGTLTLTGGVITAPNDTLIIGMGGTVSRTSGHVNGFLRKRVSPAADSLTYELGSASASEYLPVTVSFGTVSTGGRLTVGMLAGDHPDLVNSTLDPDSTVSRYWIGGNDSIVFDSYNITVQWLAGENPGIADNNDMAFAIRSNTGVWDELLPGTLTSTSFRGMTGTSFSSFAVGKGMSRRFTSVATGNWSANATWDLNKVPKKRDSVLIVSPHVVTLTANSRIEHLAVNSGGELADAGYTLDLYGNMSFSGKWSGTGQIRWNDATTDTLTGTGGKASGSSTLYVYGGNKFVNTSNDTLAAVRIGAGNTLTNLGSVAVAGTITGDNAGSTWANAAGSLVRAGGTFLSTGALTATASGNTVVYNGSGAQSVKTTTYHHLQTGTGGTKTIGGNITMKGDVTIGAGTTLAAGSTTDTVYGNWTNNGTFTAGTSTIVMGGSAAAAMAGATTFATLTLNKADSITTVTLSNGMQAGTLAMTKGTMNTGANVMTITGTRTGNGVINGTVTRTHTFAAATAYAFESPFTTVTFAAGGTLPTSFTVQTVLDSTPIVNTTMDPINRYYVLSQTGGSGYKHALRLHYEDTEIGAPNSETAPPLKMWRDSSGTWVRLGATGSSTVQNWVEFDSVVNVGSFGLSSRRITNVMLTLSANATHPSPGDEVEYTVAYNNYGDGPASNFIVMAPVPLNTSYVANSVTVNGSPAADGSPGVSVGPSALTINLSTILGGAVPGSASGNFKYKVTIN